MNFKLNFRQFGNAAHTIQHTEERERDRNQKRGQDKEKDGRKEKEAWTGIKEVKRADWKRSRNSVVASY